MKHIKSFSEITESASAGSRETLGLSPFKYSTVYDPRIGYSKKEFVEDLQIVMADIDQQGKKDMLSLIQSLTGYNTVEDVINISTRDLNRIMKSVEDFLNTKADYVISVYPDGYYLCFENIKHKGTKYDIYYHPNIGTIKIVPQMGQALENEIITPKDKFNPEDYGLAMDDFQETIDHVNASFKKKDTPYKS